MNQDSISTIEFNNQLMELLCKDVDKEIVNFCLISDELLETNHIKLSCNHKFNYDSIYNEIRNQKKTTHLETQKLSTNQIKCPYCRKVQRGLLPYRPGYIKINGVNWPPKYQYLPNTCIYKFASGKKKNQPCNKKCSAKYCANHAKIIKNRKSKADAKIKTHHAPHCLNMIIDAGSVSQHLFGDSSPVTPEKNSPGELAAWLDAVDPTPPQKHPLIAALDQNIWNTPSLPITPTPHNYYYQKIPQVPSSMPPPPPLPPKPTGCSYIFKRGNKKGKRCSCKKLYSHAPGNASTTKPICKTHYKQLVKKGIKKKAMKMVNTLFQQHSPTPILPPSWTMPSLWKALPPIISPNIIV